MSTYYRESFDYPPIRMFLDSSVASNISNNGNVNFNLNQKIQLPNNVVGYVSLQELTIANTNYNINTYNNTLVLVDQANNTQTFTKIRLTKALLGFGPRSIGASFHSYKQVQD